jgi:hypothetical protein
MPADCCKETWDKIKDTDEPVFTLRAQDALAPFVVRQWLNDARINGVNEGKIRRGREHLDAIVKWQEEHPDKVKIPD